VAGLLLGRCECGAVRYQVADGKHTRCGTCGSYLFRPIEHIFVGSKAPSFEITDDLPQYEEYEV
jgi:hypothetical protein